MVQNNQYAYVFQVVDSSDAPSVNGADEAVVLIDNLLNQQWAEITDSRTSRCVYTGRIGKQVHHNACPEADTHFYPSGQLYGQRQQKQYIYVWVA